MQFCVRVCVCVCIENFLLSIPHANTVNIIDNWYGIEFDWKNESRRERLNLIIMHIY